MRLPNFYEADSMHARARAHVCVCVQKKLKNDPVTWARVEFALSIDIYCKVIPEVLEFTLNSLRFAHYFGVCAIMCIND